MAHCSTVHRDTDRYITSHPPDVDVIGLLETDAARPYIGSHDIASWLGERLHMHTDYGPGTDEHTWGYYELKPN